MWACALLARWADRVRADRSAVPDGLPAPCTPQISTNGTTLWTSLGPFQPPRPYVSSLACSPTVVVAFVAFTYSQSPTYEYRSMGSPAAWVGLSVADGSQLWSVPVDLNSASHDINMGQATFTTGTFERVFFPCNGGAATGTTQPMSHICEVVAATGEMVGQGRACTPWLGTRARACLLVRRWVAN